MIALPHFNDLEAPLSEQELHEYASYIADLDRRDRRAFSRLVWNLLQEGAGIEDEIGQA